MTNADLLASLHTLRGDLGRVRLPLPVAAGSAAAADVVLLVHQLDDYVLPRLRDLDAPLLAVVGGSTGSGKSTLVNALIGYPVTTPGVLRPTTRYPVLVHHPADQHWFANDRILPRLPRVTGELVGTVGADDTSGVRLVAQSELPAGFALLDAPDLDSVSGANRDLAELLMAAADLWLFVTTAARYADAVPWHALRTAQQRNTAVVVVVNRVPADAIEAISAHLQALLAAEGLADAPLFVIPEVPLTDGMLPATEMAGLHDWLFELVADAATRAAIARRTVDGAVGHLLSLMPGIVGATQAQIDTRDRLAGAVREPYARAVERLMDLATDGTLMRGEVLARWQEFVGTGEVLKRLESGVGRARDRFRAAMRGGQPASDQVNEAIESRLAVLIVDAAQDAARQAEGAWRADPAGHALLGTDDLARASVSITQEAADAVRGWQSDLVDLIQAEGADKRQTARIMAFGVNGTAVALMVAVFSMTGGLTGAEVGIAGGSAVLAQKALEAVFGEDAVRRMAARASTSLADRVQVVMDTESERFLARLAALELDEHLPHVLRADTSQVGAARVAAAADDAGATGRPNSDFRLPDAGGQDQVDVDAQSPSPTGEAPHRPRPRWRERVKKWWDQSS